MLLQPVFAYASLQLRRAGSPLEPCSTWLRQAKPGGRSLVHQRGETSNRMVQFLEVLQGMGNLFKSGNTKTGRYYEWEPLAVAA